MRSVNIVSAALALACVVAVAPYSGKAADFATEKYYSANALYNKKLFDLAAEEYKSFIARYPEHPKYLNAKLGLALSLYELGRYSEAAELFGELAGNKNAPHQEQVHNLLGQCLLIANRPTEAETAFLWSVNRGKERFFMDLPGVSEKFQESPKINVATVQDLEPLERSLAGLIEALYQQGKWKQVVSYTKELEKLVPKGKYTNRARFLSALSNYELKKYADASATLNALIKTGGDLPYLEHVYFLYAECQRHLGNLEKAEEGYEIVSKKIKRKFTSNALFRLGYIKFMQEKFNGAAKDFADLRAVHGDSPYAAKAGIYLGRCYLELKRYDKAQAVFGSLTSDPEVKAEATLWLAKTFLRQDKTGEAIGILRKAVKTFADDPLLPNLHFVYGNALMRDGSYAEAAGMFAEAVKTSKEGELNADALRLEAFCLNKTRKYSESLAKCDEFLGRYGSNQSARDVAFLRAENLFFLDDLGKAAEAYKDFIPWEGKDKFTDEARYRIAQCFCEAEKWEDALTRLKPLIKDDVKGELYEQLYYLAGLCSFKLKQWSDAIDYLKKFVSRYPDRPNADAAVMKIAQAHAVRDDFKQAADSLETLIAQYPESPFMPQALTELGKYQYDLKEYPKAKKSLRRVVEQYPDSEFLPQADYYLAWTELGEGDGNAAEGRFTLVYEKFPSSVLAPDALFQHALILFKKADYLKARSLLKRFLDHYGSNEKSEQALFYYCLTFAKRGEYKEASENFKRFIAEHPKSPLNSRALYELAWSAREIGDDGLARDKYAELLSSYPTDALTKQAEFELAEVEYRKKRYDEAMVHLDKLLALDVSGDLLENVLYRIAWCYLGRKQPAEAVDYFERLLRTFPSTRHAATAAYQAGELRLQFNEYESAYKHFRKAAETAKDKELRKQALLRLGETETLTDRWKDAEKTFDVFLKEYPKDEFLRRALMWRGWTRENLKSYVKAIEDYQAVLKSGKKDALSARAQFQIGECYFEMKNYDKAIKELVKVELYPFPEWTAKAMLETGQALDRKGLADRATEQYKKVVDQFPGTDEATLADELLRERKVYYQAD